MDKTDKPKLTLVSTPPRKHTGGRKKDPNSKRGQLRARAAKARAQGRFGNKWIPTNAEKKLISVALAAGMTQEQVAGVVGVAESTLQKKCKKELADGAAGVNAKVAGKLFEKCMKGDTIALIFWTKSRMGWNDRAHLEITGKNGGPIQHETVQAEADAFTSRIASMADRFAKLMASDADEAEAANDGELTQKSTEAVGE